MPRHAERRHAAIAADRRLTPSSSTEPEMLGELIADSRSVQRSASRRADEQLLDAIEDRGGAARSSTAAAAPRLAVGADDRDGVGVDVEAGVGRATRRWRR